MDISGKIIEWYKRHKRDLPWRHSRDPYSIWVSEIILQQTRVQQGLAYYNRFMEAFPDLTSLANAPVEEVLKIWQGLGYYSRARHMKQAAEAICKAHNGIFPTSYDEIIQLPGIGSYTAAAIASIAYNQPYAVVDGNVSRVISRLYGITVPVNSTPGKKQIQDSVDRMLDQTRPGTFNQAIMELGATLCSRQNPACHHCPLNETCHAFHNGKTSTLPVKLKNRKQKTRYFNYIIPYHAGQVYVQQRNHRDIWHNLFEFPLVEADRLLSPNELKKNIKWIDHLPTNGINLMYESKPVKHILSHQIIRAKFFLIYFDYNSFNMLNFEKINIDELSKYPVSKLIERFLADLQLETYVN